MKAIRDKAWVKTCEEIEKAAKEAYAHSRRPYRTTCRKVLQAGRNSPRIKGLDVLCQARRHAKPLDPIHEAADRDDAG